MAGQARARDASKGQRLGPLGIWCRKERVALFRVAAAANVSMKTAKRVATLKDIGRVMIADLVNIAYAVGCLPGDLVPGMAVRSDGTRKRTPKAAHALASLRQAMGREDGTLNTLGEMLKEQVARAEEP